MAEPSIARVFTVTLNPAIDHTVRVTALVPGSVHRALGQQVEAGGKGVGVAAVLAALGVPVTATGWLGADNDAVFTAAFAARGIADGMLRLPGATRTNIKIADAGRGDSTDINLPGLALAPEALARAEADLCALLQAQVRAGDWCELAGSLPPGADAAVWERLARALAARGAHLAIDTGGAVLGQLLRALADPARGAVVPVAFIKPNRAELEELAGRALPTLAEVAGAARALCRDHGVRQVAVSLGGEGAVIATAADCWHAAAPRVPVATTVGAGDALVAGTLAALSQGRPLPGAATFGMACAAARIQRIAPGLPPRAEVDALAAAIAATPL
ncbi:1-phosphofructokinase family hexose kinase [Acidovorax sp. GBBC 3334]|uniref:1-phosphofructokinase family hexose kinase n=1 Tax=Acidovorax sp. GBBC 3334 TaxID=2940496 RepID=UPI0023035DBC|nr:1-phosphofructokinase family hexose kinase [Acidovorax sp. GBBC 3334]MDA8455499.1 1-phosphofructokinase family hexose kinase [Acidovorax sp. GBBC 3334]